MGAAVLQLGEIDGARHPALERRARDVQLPGKKVAKKPARSLCRHTSDDGPDFAAVTVAGASSWGLEGFQDAPEGFRKGFSTGGRVSDKGFFILAKVFRVGAGSRAPRAG